LTTHPSSDPDSERYAVIRAGFDGDHKTARQALDHGDPLVRVSALRALARLGHIQDDDLMIATRDNDSAVRRCGAELSATHPHVDLVPLLADTDIFVAEMVAWAVGEREQPSDNDVLALIDAVYHHKEVLVREAATAALGSLGDARGLPAILHACTDKPAVRRRAVLALAPFDGPEVDAALETAKTDRDWQVRQNAEDMLHPRGY
jgi:HEAT repeat protein